jgi:chemotaxis protein CheX
MQSTHIKPFLESATLVIEQTCAIRPNRGELTLKTVTYPDDHIWLQINVLGELSGDIVFGFPRQVALRIASLMMGGSNVTELDELSRSAISELGNMISGNAGTLLHEQGIYIDISPPRFFTGNKSSLSHKPAVSVPLSLDNVGSFELLITIAK